MDEGKLGWFVLFPGCSFSEICDNSLKYLENALTSSWMEGHDQ